MCECVIHIHLFQFQQKIEDWEDLILFPLKLFIVDLLQYTRLKKVPTVLYVWFFTLARESLYKVPVTHFCLLSLWRDYTQLIVLHMCASATWHTSTYRQLQVFYCSHERSAQIHFTTWKTQFFLTQRTMLTLSSSPVHTTSHTNPFVGNKVLKNVLSCALNLFWYPM